MTTGGSEPQAAAPPKKNVFARFAGVLFAPADAFQEIVRRPDIVAPLLLMIVLGFATTAVIMPRFDYESFGAMQREQFRKQQPNATEADVARVERFAIAGTKVFAWLAPVLMGLFYAIVAGVLLLAFRLMGGEGTYAQSLSVTLYAWAPLLLYSIVTAIVVLARGSFDPITAASIVKSNPAFLVEMREQPALYSLLSSLDVFSLWTLILFTIGFAAMSRLSKGVSAAIVITLWAVMVLLKVGFAAMQS
jgi:hypothetical protein